MNGFIQDTGIDKRIPNGVEGTKSLNFANDVTNVEFIMNAE